MVLVMVNPRHHESTIKQNNAWEKRSKINSIQSFNVSKNVKLKKKSQMNREWDEEFCKFLDSIAREDHSHIAHWEDRRRYRKNWKLCLNTPGPVGPVKSRPGYPETVRRTREIKREAEEAGHEINRTICLSLQVRQRPEQPFSEIWYVDGWPQNGLCMIVLFGIIFCTYLKEIDFSRLSLTGNSESLASDGGVWTPHRTTHISHTQNMISRVAQTSQHALFCCVPLKRSSPHKQIMFHAKYPCLICRLFHFRTAHLLYSFPRTEISTAIHTLEDSLADCLNKALSFPRKGCFLTPKERVVFHTPKEKVVFHTPNDRVVFSRTKGGCGSSHTRREGSFPHTKWEGSFSHT